MGASAGLIARLIKSDRTSWGSQDARTRGEGRAKVVKAVHKLGLEFSVIAIVTYLSCNRTGDPYVARSFVSNLLPFVSCINSIGLLCGSVHRLFGLAIAFNHLYLLERYPSSVTLRDLVLGNK